MPRTHDELDALIASCVDPSSGSLHRGEVGMLGWLVGLAWGQDVVGTWRYVDPAWGETITLDFAADGTGRVDGEPVRWTRSGGALVLTLGGERLTYAVQLTPTSLTASGGDLEGTVVFQRIGGATPSPSHAPPSAPSTAAASVGAAGSGGAIVGVWVDGQGGRIELSADGSGVYVGQRLTWTYDGAKLVLTGPGGVVPMDVTVDGDRFVVRADGQTQVLVREGSTATPTAPDPVATTGVAGVYTVTESSIDPSNALVISQVLTLWPDGTVGWSKSEMGASRSAVSDQLERFASFRTGGGGGATYGRWQASGADVVVQWSIWNGLRSTGRIDASGALTLSGMGILQESATLTYQRQR